MYFSFVSSWTVCGVVVMLFGNTLDYSISLDSGHFHSAGLNMMDLRVWEVV